MAETITDRQRRASVGPWESGSAIVRLGLFVRSRAPSELIGTVNRSGSRPEALGLLSLKR